MLLANKFGKAVSLVKLSAAVAWNTGVMPVGHMSMVNIEPTSVCNLSCPLCPTGSGTLKRDNKYMSMVHFDRIMELTKPHAQGYVLNIFGEPTFHPEFRQMLEKTKDFPTWLSTHLNYGEHTARLLAEFDHLHIICSVDTIHAEEYTDYRVGGDYEKVMSNLDILAAGNCNVYPQFLVPEQIYAEGDYLAFAKAHSIPVENMIIKKKLEYYRLDPTDKPTAGVCHSCYSDFYFNCDGYLVPCCNNIRKDLYIQHVDSIGTAEELFSGARVMDMRKRLADDKNQFSSCGRCPGVNYWDITFRPYIESAKTRLSFGGKCEGKMTRTQF